MQSGLFRAKFYFPYPTNPLFAVSAVSDSYGNFKPGSGRGHHTGWGDIFGWRRLSLVPHKLYPLGSSLWLTPMRQHSSHYLAHLEGTPHGKSCFYSALSYSDRNGGLLPPAWWSSAWVLAWLTFYLHGRDERALGENAWHLIRRDVHQREVEEVMS